MAAVRNEPCALKFAMEEVQADPEVCEVALRGAHAALQFVSPALYEDRKVLDALVEGYIQRRRSHEQPITVDQGLRELKEHAGPALRARHAFWQQVGERLMRAEADDLLADEARAEAYRSSRGSSSVAGGPGGPVLEAGYLSAAEATRIKREFFEYMLARTHGDGAEDFAATGQGCGVDCVETSQCATAADEVLLRELLAYEAYEAIPHTEGEVVAVA